MHSATLIFIVLGSILVLGLATDYLGRKSRLPRVTLLFLFGFVLGPGGIALIPEKSLDWFPLIADTALLLVGFLLGGKITLNEMARNGKTVMVISLSVVLVTILVVTVGMYLVGVPLAVALLLAGIATATDPVATLDVISESGARGRFTDTLVEIVAIDDAWGLIAFSILLAVVHLLNGNSDVIGIFGSASYELLGAMMLGVVLGVPMAYISGRIKPGQPTLIEALGMVFLCGGLAQWLEVSYLLSAMVMGIVVTNLARHHDQAFHEIEDIEWPFMILFFVLTGASLKIDMLLSAGFITIAYIAFRFAGRIAGSYPGGLAIRSSPGVRNWMGLALLPQAGVATGMALIAASEMPELGKVIIPVVVIATIVFEMIGPVFTRISLENNREVQDED